MDGGMKMAVQAGKGGCLGVITYYYPAILLGAFHL